MGDDACLALQEAKRRLTALADEREAFIKQQSGFYVQYEDRGMTMVRVQALREAAQIVQEVEDNLPSPTEPARS